LNVEREQTDDSPLQGVEWTLVWFGAVEAPTPAVPDHAATLSFDGESFFGSTGCNRMRGGYQAAGDLLTIGPAISTRRACLNEAAANQERAILAALNGQLDYSIRDGELHLSYDDSRQALVYVAPGEAGGTARDQGGEA
jgi:heat shock protein HslJ